jgi:hypothetical protein
VLLTVAIATASASCGTTRDQSSDPTLSTKGAVPRLSGAGRFPCPRHVLSDESIVTPVSRVLAQAQRLLAHQRYGSQGSIYRLTPRNAPIDEVFRLAAIGGALDETQPGLVRLHRAARRQCGERTAQASWAIHYWIPVSVISNAGGWTFLVKTRSGWRFWGHWCGAGKSEKWRNYYCY